MPEKHTSDSGSTTTSSTTSTIKSAFQKLLAKAPSSSSLVRDPGTDMARPGPAEEKTRALEARVAYLANRS
ncbi:hypothetical protein HOY82DRAFT_493654 [Tuber indicum]|nr:hypothetical protein HOY82DRAFT_493654 [Tuber indicum]